MERHIDFERYQKFVDAVTSDASTDFLALSDRLVALDEKGANIERLLTAGVGINAEGGEFLEIIKKMVFQGKPWNDDNREHLIIELGDLMWYVAQACMALGVSFDDVIATNVKKLEKRYPEGTFDVYFSENRAASRCRDPSNHNSGVSLRKHRSVPGRISFPRKLLQALHVLPSSLLEYRQSWIAYRMLFLDRLPLQQRRPCLVDSHRRSAVYHHRRRS